MNRRALLKSLITLPFVTKTMQLDALNKVSESLKTTARMPVLFLGHGSPMNAITDNDFTRSFQKIGNEIPKPQLILCISAHWETYGTYVTAMENPKTIHDFGGFPQALFDAQYPAPGSPKSAEQIQQLIQTPIASDYRWGLDHGTWSVLTHLYPNADVPVMQLSLDRDKSPQAHYELAQQLSVLRRKGVLIVGSGNNVHNLRMLGLGQDGSQDFAHNWATDANEKMKEFIRDRNHKALIDFRKQGKAFNYSINTAEHFLPLIYALGLQEKDEKPEIFNDKPYKGAIYMTSLKIS